MKSYRISINGEVSIRGFWLYVWIIKYKHRVLAYVGRTGDSSSIYATSPMLRLGQHLDSRRSSSTNMLHRNLKKMHIDPAKCKYDFIAVGPLFREQTTIVSHRKYRDITASLETALSIHMKEKGFLVIGKHPTERACDKKKLFQVKKAIDLELRAR